MDGRSSFESVTGTVTYDHAICANCESKVCVKECIPQILKLEDGKPVLAISKEEAKKGKCTECLVCDIECWMRGAGGGYVELPIPGLQDYIKKDK